MHSTHSPNWQRLFHNLLVSSFLPYALVNYLNFVQESVLNVLQGEGGYSNS